MDRKAKLLPLGNFLFRSAGAVLVMLALKFHDLPLASISNDPAQQIVAVHVLFNLLLVLVCLPLTRPVAWLVERLVPDREEQEEADRLTPQSALDKQLVGNPGLPWPVQRANSCVWGTGRGDGKTGSHDAGEGQ